MTSNPATRSRLVRSSVSTPARTCAFRSRGSGQGDLDRVAVLVNPEVDRVIDRTSGSNRWPGPGAPAPPRAGHRDRPSLRVCRGGFSCVVCGRTGCERGSGHLSIRLQAVPSRGRAGLRRTACASAPSAWRLQGGRAPMGRRPCAGKAAADVEIIPAGRRSSQRARTASTPLRAPIPPVVTTIRDAQAGAWSGGGLGGSGVTPPGPAKCRPGSRGCRTSGQIPQVMPSCLPRRIV
jgi:hypothetical protein